MLLGLLEKDKKKGGCVRASIVLWTCSQRTVPKHHLAHARRLGIAGPNEDEMRPKLCMLSEGAHSMVSVNRRGRHAGNGVANLDRWDMGHVY